MTMMTKKDDHPIDRLAVIHQHHLRHRRLVCLVPLLDRRHPHLLLENHLAEESQ